MTQRKHILVVEDEQHLAFGIQYNLEAEGYRTTTVGNGQSALKLFEGDVNEFDLIILDLMLPGMSGYAVCDAIRAAGNNLPILILSARTLAEDRTRGFDLGANQYLTKPFELEELLSRVNNLLSFALSRNNRSQREAGLETFEFATACVNFASHEVTVNGDPLRMTNLELKLLRYFADNEGRVVSRHELLEKVWEQPGNLSTRAPDQFIRRLRKYFESNPADPRHFLTVRDAGYRFVIAGATEDA